MASVAQVPAISEVVKTLAGQFMKAEIEEPEAQYMLRSALVLAALKKAQGHRRRAARYLGIPLAKFQTWLHELALEETASELRRACASQLALQLVRPRRSRESPAAQSFPAGNSQHLLQREG